MCMAVKIHNFMKNMKKLLLITLILLPTLTFAKNERLSINFYPTGNSGYSSSYGESITDINSLSRKATNIGNLFIGIIISLCVVWIIWNAFHYFVAKGPDERKEGGMAIFYGVIALFVIFSIWGIVNIFRNSFRFQDNNMPELTNLRLPDPVAPRR
jgi:bacteriorhodopsin